MLHQSSAELSHSLKVSDCRRDTPKICPESFGIAVCRFVGTVPSILSLVWPSFRPKSFSKSKIPGRILKSIRGPSAQPPKGAVTPRKRPKTTPCCFREVVDYRPGQTWTHGGLPGEVRCFEGL